jgi:hypothetical protein
LSKGLIKFHIRLHFNERIFQVIHPTVKVKLKQYGINTLDRLGRQYTPYFCYLTGRRIYIFYKSSMNIICSGCQPIETLTLNTLDERYFGTLTEIKQIEIGKKSFLQLFNQTRPFHTLLLCSNTEQVLLEFKVNIRGTFSLVILTFNRNV